MLTERDLLYRYLPRNHHSEKIKKGGGNQTKVSQPQHGPIQPTIIPFPFAKKGKVSYS